MSFFKILSFLSLLVGFFRGKEERTSQHPNFLVGLTLLDMGFFEPSVMGGGQGHEGPHHNSVVIAPMIMKFGTGVKLDVFYTMVTK